MTSILETSLVPYLRKFACADGAAGATDAELLGAFLSCQEESAFRAIIDRHGPMVMGVCRRVLQNVHDAEDAFQATFLVLARKSASIVPRESVANRLHGVAYRTALKTRTRRSRNTSKLRMYERVMAMPKQTSITPKTWHDLEPIIDEELERLPKNYRAPVVLCDLEGKTRKDAARQLGWPEGTVSGRLARARKLLAKRLTARGVTLSVVTLSSALTTSTASAAVPAILKSNVVRAGLLIACGKIVPASLVSLQVCRLSEQVAKSVLLAKHWVAAAFLTAAGLVLTGTGLVAQKLAGDNNQSPQVSEPKSAPRSVSDQRKQPPNAEMHVIGVYESKAGRGEKGRVDVEVRRTEKPVVLVMTSYFPVEWTVKLADGARLSQVITSGYNAQEVVGVPAGVPIINRSYFPDDGSRSQDGWFWANEFNTLRWREMVRRLNELTGIPVATFQSANSGESFVIDGNRGRDLGQKELSRRVAPAKEPTPEELLKLSADAELHITGTYGPANDNPSKPIEVDVRTTSRPVVLVLTSYLDAVWNVKCANGARIKAVILAGYSPQEIDGLPADVPVVNYCPTPASLFEGYNGDRQRKSFYVYQWNTLESRRMVEKLNEMTGLLVSTFQGANSTSSFVVDGKRGLEHAQKERKSRPAPPKEIKPADLILASVGADIHVVSIYWAGPGKNGSPVEIEVQPTGKPIVLALVSYYSVLWKVKIAEGAQVKAVIVTGYFEQEYEGIPEKTPIVLRTYFPSLNRDFCYGYKLDTPEYRNVIEKLNTMTGRLISTSQLQESGESFVIDGRRGRELEQKARLSAEIKSADAAKKQPKQDDDPLADIADVPSKELRAGGDVDKRYYLIGPKKGDAKPPSEGYSLCIIMPGGDGSADFHPFVKRIYKNALGGDYLVAQPIAMNWTQEQAIVWPTKLNPVEKMKFSTEEFVSAVIEDVAKNQKIDRSKVFTLT